MKRLPMKYNRKYWMDWGSTSSGVRIHTRIWGVRKMPTSISKTPQTMAKAKSVCTAASSRS